jgi:hypothetical protein
MKTILAKTSFFLFSALIILLAYHQAKGETRLVCGLAGLAALCAIWALAGLYNPRSLFFAHEGHQTRENAFFFPFWLGVLFAFCAGLESVGPAACAVPADAPWLTHYQPGLCTLIFCGGALPLFIKRGATLYDSFSRLTAPLQQRH